MAMNCPGYSAEFDPTQMFRDILVPIDFTPESRRALITACELRNRFGSRVHLFVDTDYTDRSALRGIGVPYGHDEAVRNARTQLEHFATSVCQSDHGLQTDAAFGHDVPKDIAEFAAAHGCTMVIMGVHHKHSWFRTRAEKIVRSLTIPVFVLQGQQLVAAEDTAATDAIPAPA